MKPLFSALTIPLSAVLVVLGSAGCGTSPEPPKQGGSVASHASSALADQMFAEINAYRRSKGAKDLQRHPGLDQLARQHCEYLRQHRGSFTINGKNVSHIGFDGRYAFARERFQMGNLSENVASVTHPGGHAVSTLIQLWKNSPEHHKTMTDSWTHSGVAVVVDDDGTVFADQLFGVVASTPHMITRERFSQF